MTGDETAIEVLRMTAEIRSGHTSIVTSAVVVAVTALLTFAALLTLLLGGGVITTKVTVLLILSIVFGLMNIVFIGFGWKRLNNALKSNNKEQPIISGTVIKTLPEADISTLPPAPVSFSVTDGTTKTLNFPEKTPVPENRHRKTTNDLN